MTPLRDWIPPALHSGLLHLRHGRPRRFEGYEQALAASGGEGYSAVELVATVVEKNRRWLGVLGAQPLSLNDTRILSALAMCERTSGTLRVVDFGGGGGNHFALARQALPRSVDLRWQVVETPSLVAAAQPLVSPTLGFSQSLNDAVSKLDGVDLVFASSSLQYCPNPMQALSELCAIGAPVVYITRTPLIEARESLHTLQRSRLADNGPGPMPKGQSDRWVSTPITYVPRVQFEAVAFERYEPVLRFQEDSSAFAFPGASIAMWGYALRLCESQAQPQ